MSDLLDRVTSGVDDQKRWQVSGSQQQSRAYHPNLRVERDGDVTTVMIDRPETKNACTGDMWVAIGAAFRDIGYSRARVVVLTGGGGDFCAGDDLDAGGGDGGGSVRGKHHDAARLPGEVVRRANRSP